MDSYEIERLRTEKAGSDAEARRAWKIVRREGERFARCWRVIEEIAAMQVGANEAVLRAREALRDG